MTAPAINQNLELCLTREQIQLRIQQMGAEISRDFSGQSVLLIGVLKGAAVFLADLSRTLAVDCAFDFIAVSSYDSGQHSNGDVRLIQNLDQPIENRNVLLVEDILDTGATLYYLQTLLLQRRPAMLKIATLLDKPSHRVQQIQADYVGFTIPDRFVVGYGMDYAEHYRNLSDIYFLPTDI